VHDLLVRHVAVGEHRLVHPEIGDQRLQIAFRVGRAPVRGQFAGERRRVAAAVDVRDLGGGEADHVEILAVPVHDVEVVEVPPGGSQDQDLGAWHLLPLSCYPSARRRGCLRGSEGVPLVLLRGHPGNDRMKSSPAGGPETKKSALPEALTLRAVPEFRENYSGGGNRVKVRG
jgi:hypothetical protein